MESHRQKELFRKQIARCLSGCADQMEDSGHRPARRVVEGSRHCPLLSVRTEYALMTCAPASSWGKKAWGLGAGSRPMDEGQMFGEKRFSVKLLKSTWWFVLDADDDGVGASRLKCSTAIWGLRFA